MNQDDFDKLPKHTQRFFILCLIASIFLLVQLFAVIVAICIKVVFL